MSFTNKTDVVGQLERLAQAQFLDRARRARCPDHPDKVPVVTLSGEMLSGHATLDVADPCCAKLETAVHEAASTDPDKPKSP